MKIYQFDGIENFRDLGGYPSFYGETSHGMIYRSARLYNATKSDIDRIAKLGIKTILDLRDDKAKEEHPDPMKGDKRFNVIELPVNGNGRIPKDYDDGIVSYMEMVEEPYTARSIFKAILNSPKPMLIHCSAGKDRTGVFCAMLLACANVPLEVINSDYMASFPLLPKMTKETRTYHKEVNESVLVPNTDQLPKFFETFYKRYGSLENYFEAIGISDDEFRSLRSILGKREKSCGAVLFHNGKVLVEHMNFGHYSIPKGHVEAFDKDEFDTARREIKEETGLNVSSFLDGFRHSIYYSPKEGIIKEVVFFIAYTDEEKTTPQKEEVNACYWVSPADAVMVLSHDSDRDVIIEASKFEAAHSSKNN